MDDQHTPQRVVPGVHCDHIRHKAMFVLSVPNPRARDFYDEYYAVLYDGELERWPDLFTEDCLYRVIPRENYERGYTLCTMQAESRGMLQDRVTGLRRAQIFAPRYYRRFGFRPAEPLGVTPPETGWGDAFQARPLTAYTPRLAGPFRYAAAFTP